MKKYGAKVDVFRQVVINSSVTIAEGAIKISVANISETNGLIRFGNDENSTFYAGTTETYELQNFTLPECEIEAPAGCVLIVLVLS